MPPATRYRVLCVDDDEDACEMLSVLMSLYGIDAFCAQSAVAAWPLIKGKDFDLFMLDGWLPGIDGFEFCRQIREFDSNTPILFYSGAAYDEDKRRGIAAGANAYVTKPDVQGLVETIVKLIANARTRDIAKPRVSEPRLPVQHSLSAHSSVSIPSAMDLIEQPAV